MLTEITFYRKFYKSLLYGFGGKIYLLDYIILLFENGVNLLKQCLPKKVWIVSSFKGVNICQMLMDG